ncbi:MAG: hypothetical protein QOC93_540 [Actinomycetota bacterium]|jgi:hypothetical protein|nr:hypothetical protein [Actinomycetota bacterium]
MSQRCDGDATRGGFEWTGGYPSPAVPVSALPKVPAGPAPGARPTGAESAPAPAAAPAEATPG